MADAAAKTHLNGRGKKRATASDKRKILLETEIANVKAAHTHLVDISARAEKDVNYTKTELRDLQVCFIEITIKAKVAGESIEEARQ